MFSQLNEALATFFSVGVSTLPGQAALALIHGIESSRVAIHFEIEFGREILANCYAVALAARARRRKSDAVQFGERALFGQKSATRTEFSFEGREQTMSATVINIQQFKKHKFKSSRCNDEPKNERADVSPPAHCEPHKLRQQHTTRPLRESWGGAMSWKLRDRVNQKNIHPWKLKYLLETIADGCIGESTICAIGKYRIRESMGIDKKTLNGLIAKAEKQGLLTVEEKGGLGRGSKWKFRLQIEHLPDNAVLVKKSNPERIKRLAAVGGGKVGIPDQKGGNFEPEKGGILERKGGNFEPIKNEGLKHEGKISPRPSASETQRENSFSRNEERKTDGADSRDGNRERSADPTSPLKEKHPAEDRARRRALAMSEIEAVYREFLEAMGSREKFDVRKQEIALERFKECAEEVRDRSDGLAKGTPHLAGSGWKMPDEMWMRRTGAVFRDVIERLLDDERVKAKRWGVLCQSWCFHLEIKEDQPWESLSCPCSDRTIVGLSIAYHLKCVWPRETKPEGAVQMCRDHRQCWIVPSDDPAKPLQCTSGKADCSSVKRGGREWQKCTLHARGWIVESWDEKTRDSFWRCSSDPACAYAAQISKKQAEEEAERRRECERAERERAEQREAERLAEEAERLAEEREEAGFREQLMQQERLLQQQMIEDRREAERLFGADGYDVAEAKSA
jgi:hypothetical protein